MIRAIDSSNLKNDYSQAQKVTYKYYVGRKAMFDSDFKLGKEEIVVLLKKNSNNNFDFQWTDVIAAEEFLSYSFDHCHRSSQKNKRMILIYLLPVKMLLVKKQKTEK